MNKARKQTHSITNTNDALYLSNPQQRTPIFIIHRIHNHSMSVAGPSRLGPRIARLPHRSVLEVSGPDARKFLNGQSCKNIEALGGGYSGFLNASVRTKVMSDQ